MIFPMGTDGIAGELTKKDGLELTRENIQKTTEKYRQKYGMDYLAKLTLQKIIDSGVKKALIPCIPTDFIWSVAGKSDGMRGVKHLQSYHPIRLDAIGL